MMALHKVYRFLASLKLAVILLLSLSVILALATYYEARYDASTAAHLVYGSPWFSLFLCMLGMNVLCAALVRYPWKRHQTGFVMVHLGIIVILVGAFITRTRGFEGLITLSEGDSASTVTLNVPQLSYQLQQGADVGDVHTLSAEFRWNPPRDGHEIRYPLAQGFVAVVDRYIHHAQPALSYRKTSSTEGTPALRMQISAGKGAPMPEGTIMADEWLALADPDRREVHMGPATMRLIQLPAGPDGQAAASGAAALTHALQPFVPAKLDASKGLLVLDAGTGRPQTISVAENVGREVAVDGTRYRVRVDRYLAHAAVDQGRLIDRSDRKMNPAVEYTVLDARGDADRQVAFARYPEFSASHHQKRQSSVKATFVFADTRKPSNGIDFMVAPDGKLYARVYSSGGTSHAGVQEVGKTVATGWRMNLNYTVLEFIPHAEAVHGFREMNARRAQDNFTPAIRVRIEGADQPGPYWLQQGDAVRVTRDSRSEVLHLIYHLEAINLGFRIRLRKFEVTYDAGTRNPASYTSQVSVDDPTQDRPMDAAITMNEPLHYRGLIFFQASFSDNGGRMASIFQVSRDPGVPVKYGGSILLVLGIATYVFSTAIRQ